MNEIPRPSITEVWEHYDGRVIGRETGGWRKAYCVLHEDATPSAQVNEDEGKYRCFTCDVYGDVIDLIERHDGLSFLDACRVAAGFDGGGHSGVPSTDYTGSGLLPRRKGHREGRRSWVPAWRRG